MYHHDKEWMDTEENEIETKQRGFYPPFSPFWPPYYPPFYPVYPPILFHRFPPVFRPSLLSPGPAPGQKTRLLTKGHFPFIGRCPFLKPAKNRKKGGFRMDLKPIIPFEPVTTDDFPQGKQWIAQVKWDGVRILAYRNRNEIKLFNRKKNERTFHYPELQHLDQSLRAKSAILDGEVIALKDGKPSFYEVMKRDGLRNIDRVLTVQKQVPVTYMVFDLLYLDVLQHYRDVIDRSVAALHGEVPEQFGNTRLMQELRREPSSCSTAKEGWPKTSVGRGRQVGGLLSTHSDVLSLGKDSISSNNNRSGTIFNARNNVDSEGQMFRWSEWSPRVTRLNAPREDGAKLIEPPLRLAGEIASVNQQTILGSVYDLQGRTLPQLAREAHSATTG